MYVCGYVTTCMMSLDSL